MQKLKDFLGFSTNLVNQKIYIRANLTTLALLILFNIFIRSTMSNELISLSNSVIALYIVLALALGILALVVYVMTTIKRLRDIKMNERWVILALIPYLNLIFFFYLCFQKSKA
jgi:uncharacterized membrane protein YhaH (DUF805 family)